MKDRYYNAGRVVIILILSFVLNSNIYAQEKKVAEIPQKQAREVKNAENQQTAKEGRAIQDKQQVTNRKKKKKEGSSRQVKGSARPPYIARPTGAAMPRGAGKPGGAIRPGRR